MIELLRLFGLSLVVVVDGIAEVLEDLPWLLMLLR